MTLSFPPLPPGHSYLNPENLTPEQVGVDDGWRPLCTLDERYPEDHQFLIGRDWQKGAPCSGKPDYGHTDPTYRTRAPIPGAGTITFTNPSIGLPPANITKNHIWSVNYEPHASGAAVPRATHDRDPSQINHGGRLVISLTYLGEIKP